MQAGYAGYTPYNPHAPFPPAAPYYAPQAAYPPNGYVNGTPVDMTMYPEYSPWPSQPQSHPGATPMPRPRQLSERWQVAEDSQMPRPKRHSTKNDKTKLKSAMKKPARSQSAPVPAAHRTRKSSDPKRTLHPVTRARTNSNAGRECPGRQEHPSWVEGVDNL